MAFNILSWNVNGLRSFKQPIKVFLDDLNADIICLQETKVTRDMLTEDLAVVDGYTSYFAFSRRRSGYSGVATYARLSCTPHYATEGLCGIHTTAEPPLKLELETGTKLESEIIQCEDSISSRPTGLRLPGDGPPAVMALTACVNESHQQPSPLMDTPTSSSCGSSSAEDQATRMKACVMAAGRLLEGPWSRQELREVDSEGRAVITLHLVTEGGERGSSVPLAIINVYCPRADPNRSDRGDYRLQFYACLRQRAALLCRAGARVVVLGDINCSHTKLDHCEPDQNFHLNPGRQFMDKFILRVDKTKLNEEQKQQTMTETDEDYSPSSNENEDHFESTINSNDCRLNETSDLNCSEIRDPFDNFQIVDTFRYLYPKRMDAFTCWNTNTNARDTNYGTRIDYILCDKALLSSVKDSSVLSDVHGSDHCPVALSVDLNSHPCRTPPQFCTQHYPEFQGQQQNILNYFEKVTSIPGSKSDGLINSLHKSDETIMNNSKLVSQDNQSQLPKCNGTLTGFIQPTKVYDNDNTKLSVSDNREIVHCVKRKMDNNVHKSNKKRSQQNLLSYFESKNKSTEKLGHESTQKWRPSGSGKKSISLYEAEMQFMRNNPDVYNQLGLREDGHVNMEALKINYFTNIDSLIDKRALTEEQYKVELKSTESSPDFHVNLVDFVSLPTSNKVHTSVNSHDENVISGSNDQDINSSELHYKDRSSEHLRRNRYVDGTECINNQNSADTSFSSVQETDPSCEEVDNLSSPSIECASQSATSSISENSLRHDWSFMQQKIPIPLCPGHKEPCVIRTTKKKGPNFNRRFFACNRGAGRTGQKEAQCNFFKWL